MRTDTQKISPLAAPGARPGTGLEHASGARPARWVPIVAVLAATTAVLLASGLAVVSNLS
jgi:hypothetical protein